MNHTRVDCYFDYISPFAYLHHEQLHRLPGGTSVNFIPVLFAGLLKHWGTLGPVEVKEKKIFTYRHVTWLADQLNIPFRIPDTHPFVPLPYLRLTIAMNNDPELITKIYRSIWTTKLNPATEQGRLAIFNSVGVDNAETLINTPDVKQTLISNTAEACKLGVFGVPTLVIDGQFFWGLDSLDFAIDYIHNKSMFSAENMSRLEAI